MLKDSLSKLTFLRFIKITFPEPKKFDRVTKYWFQYSSISVGVRTCGGSSNIWTGEIGKIATFLVSDIKTFPKKCDYLLDVFDSSENHFIMMSRQATAVAVKADGATNQKSWGDPNQHRGVIKAAQNKISLLTSENKYTI